MVWKFQTTSIYRYLKEMTELDLNRLKQKEITFAQRLVYHTTTEKKSFL